MSLGRGHGPWLQYQRPYAPRGSRALALSARAAPGTSDSLHWAHRHTCPRTFTAGWACTRMRYRAIWTPSPWTNLTSPALAGGNANTHFIRQDRRVQWVLSIAPLLHAC